MNHKTYKKVVLIILDGFGIAPKTNGNAVAQAKIPTLDYIAANYPSLTLQASGPLVGLPWGEMGNSEVGHLNIGAGRIVGQDLPRITNAIHSGDFFKNPIFLEAIKHAKDNNSSFHLMGLVSPGGVHSLDEHLYALLAMAKEHGLSKVFIHMFADGRDTSPKVAQESLKELSERVEQIGVGRVATISGRFYGMDRGGHWNQTMMAFDAMVNGQGQTATTAEALVQNSYGQQIFDEMIKPAVVVDEIGQPIGKISDNDSVLFINFRSDRALQLTQAFVQPTDMPEEFRKPVPKNLYFVTMTEYYMYLPAHVAFPPTKLKNNLAEILSKMHFTQFHIAESEKYAHVTAFFNCGRTEKFFGEERVIVTSPEDNARNYSDNPAMSAVKLTDELVAKIKTTPTNFFLANFANPDMVGHTGNLPAGIAAVESVDACLKKIMDAALDQDAALIITADHGNVEQLVDPKTGDIDKDHTTNPVPFLLIANEFMFHQAFEHPFMSLASRVPGGVISDVAPTILELFGLPKPDEMTGVNLLLEIDEVPVKMVNKK